MTADLINVDVDLIFDPITEAARHAADPDAEITPPIPTTVVLAAADAAKVAALPADEDVSASVLDVLSERVLRVVADGVDRYLAGVDIAATAAHQRAWR